MNIPILYVGAPGVGKTATIREKYDYCEVLLLSSQTEEDIAGIPYREGTLEHRTIPPFIQRLQSAQGTKCLFLDEIDKARREVADTLLTLVTHPEQFGIPEGTDIVAAANPPEWGGGDGLSLPMMNRFSIIPFNPDFKAWSEYIIKKFGKLPFILEVIHKIESRELPFLESNGDGLNWRMTSPRSIDNVLTVCTTENDKDHVHNLVKGLVTPNFASGILLLFTKHFNQEPIDTYSEKQEFSRSIASKSFNKVILRK